MNTKLAHSITPDMPPMFFAESHASTPQECQQKAAETLLNSRNKAILLEMAEAWISHGEQQKAKA
jgi:hypothetical protein